MQDKPRTALYPRNDQGHPHGHWNKYHNDNTLWYKCDYINGKLHGYYEYRIPNGDVINIYYAR